MCGFEVFCDVKVGNLILQTAIFDIFCNVPGWVLRLNEGYTLSFQVENLPFRWWRCIEPIVV